MDVLSLNLRRRQAVTINPAPPGRLRALPGASNAMDFDDAPSQFLYDIPGELLHLVELDETSLPWHRPTFRERIC